MSDNTDGPLYLQNLGLMSKAAQDYGLRFMNTVQSCAPGSGYRIPTGNEMRYLVYSTLAYGTQGISYYGYLVGAGTGTSGGIINADGTYTDIGNALMPLNREFVNVAEQTQTLHCIGTYLKGYNSFAMPPGTTRLPGSGSPFSVTMGDGSSVPNISYSRRESLKRGFVRVFRHGRHLAGRRDVRTCGESRLHDQQDL